MLTQYQSLYLNLSFRALISLSVCARSSALGGPLGFSTAIAFSKESSFVRKKGL